MAKLVIYEEIEDADTVLEDFELIIPQMLIGSGPDNELVLEAPDIDPTHASLELRDNQWILQDLGGPGGTVVNGEEIQGPFRLHHGDFIELGPVKMRFEDIEAAVEAAPSPEEDPPDAEVQIRGRVWFATIASGTVAAIFIILLLLIIADYLGLLEITDLLPLWFG
jgi:pSer/pThr/pTyr-binding forkhead associated (FHA) protein